MAFQVNTNINALNAHVNSVVTQRGRFFGKVKFRFENQQSSR